MRVHVALERAQMLGLTPERAVWALLWSETQTKGEMMASVAQQCRCFGLWCCWKRDWATVGEQLVLSPRQTSSTTRAWTLQSTRPC